MKCKLPFLAMAALGMIAGTVNAQCPGTTADTLFQSDFETDNGGFIESGGGDWEYGVIPEVIAGANCGSAFSSPGGAYSGTHGWATILNDCYQNLGTESATGFTVDLSDPEPVSAKLVFAQWFEVFVNFDYLQVFANGAEVYRNDTTEDSNTWLPREVDLTSYLGQSAVAINFSLHASTVVNRAGWYIDDVGVIACSAFTTGIDGVSAATIRVWPNPATDVLHVEVPGSDPVLNWTLYDATGRVMSSSAVSSQDQFTIDVAAFHGMAVLELQRASGASRQRVMLQ